MLLSEIGAQLQERRTAQGLQLEDIAERSKIPVKMIRALEAGNLELLPEAAYVRKFVESYALILGFDRTDAEVLVNSADELKVEAEPPKSLEAQRVEKLPEISSHSGIRYLVELLIVAAIGLGAYLFYVNSYRDVPVAAPEEKNESSAWVVPPASTSNSEASSVPNSVASNDGAEQSMGAAQSNVSVSEHAAPVPPASIQDSGAGAGTSTGMGASAAASESLVEQPANLENTLPADTAIPAGMHRIEVVAAQECWVQIRPDDKKELQQLLKPGTSMTVDFSAKAAVRLGKPDGVTLLYDGKTFEFETKSGRVVNLNFPPSR